jgi:EAL domain-containing protein (putative c-di-GMP-specific phosphodiesterase class I)
VLSLARMQSKLHTIENITWFESMRTFTDQVDRGLIPYNVKIFINSMGGAVLSGDERQQFYEKYYDYLKNLVFEITEAEQDDDDIVRIKRDIARQWNAQIAIDDYGSGYNSEISLLVFQPQIVKVDMSIVQGVDHDADRQNLLKNLIQYAKQRGIRVVAEGVQTREELQTVIKCGVDYVQGYYLAKPDYIPRDITAKQKLEIGKLKHGI